jgi:hypothetical protein
MVRSSNIFRIWIPQEHKAIATWDVTFDESRKYHPDNLTFELSERVEEPLQTIEFPDHSELARGIEFDEEEFETLSVADSVDSDQSSTIQVIPRTNSGQKTQQERAQYALPTPEDTPAPTAPTPGQISAPPQARPRQEIVGDLSESSIVEGARTRKPSKRNQCQPT